MTHKYGQVNKGRVKTSTKFVHRCVSLTKVNKGEQSQGLLKSMKRLKTFELWESHALVIHSHTQAYIVTLGHT